MIIYEKIDKNKTCPHLLCYHWQPKGCPMNGQIINKFEFCISCQDINFTIQDIKIKKAT